MSILWLTFEIAINIFQGWLYTFFLQKQLHRSEHRSTANLIISTVITILAVAAFYSLYIWIELPITDSVVFILTFLYSIYLFSDKWYIKLLWNVILGVLLVAIASFTATLIINVAGVSWETIMEPSLLRLGYLLCGNAILFVVYYIITRIKPHQEKLSWYALGLFLILNIIILIAMEMQYHLSWQENVPSSPVLITIFCMLFIIAGLLAMFELLSYKADKEAELESQISTSRLMEAHFVEMKSMYQTMMEYQHDMKHQLNTLQVMIDAGRLRESTTYLEELRQHNLPTRYSTGCISIDALLSAKVSYMKQLHIEFEFHPYPLNELPIAEHAFCSIIGNLLDNAIEAITRIDVAFTPKKISLCFSRVRDMLYISCKNNTNGQPLQRRGNNFLSSKRKNRLGHGISSIHRIVDQAEGFSNFKLCDSMFIAEIILPYRQGECENERSHKLVYPQA